MLSSSLWPCWHWVKCDGTQPTLPTTICPCCPDSAARPWQQVIQHVFMSYIHSRTPHLVGHLPAAVHVEVLQQGAAAAPQLGQQVVIRHVGEAQLPQLRQSEVSIVVT